MVHRCGASHKKHKTVIKSLFSRRVQQLRPAFLCGIIIRLNYYNNARRDFEKQ